MKQKNVAENCVLHNHNGITLIALIITIIVMLILVAVTITMAVNGGLFGYAGNAAKETEEAKQKELDWLNVEGLSTDQLIAKFTTDRKKDLEFLRQVLQFDYGNADWDNMTEKEEEMWDQYEEYMHNEELSWLKEPEMDNYGILKFHDAFYKVTITYENEEPNALTVEPYTLTTADLLDEIIENGTDLEWFYVAENIEYRYYSYENNTYKIAYDTNNDRYIGAYNLDEGDRVFLAARDILFNGTSIGEFEIGNSQYAFANYNNKTYKLTIDRLTGKCFDIEEVGSKVFVFSDNNYIEFELSNANTTWYQWASDPNNTDDLDLSYIHTGLTLKSLITTVNGQENKEINYSTGTNTGYYLNSNYNLHCYSNQLITSGEICIMTGYMPEQAA